MDDSYENGSGGVLQPNGASFEPALKRLQSLSVQQMSDWRQEALVGAYRQLASGLSALLRAYRELWPKMKRAPGAQDMIAGALAQLEELGVEAVYIQEEDPPGQWLDDTPSAPFSIEWTDRNPGPCSICAADVGRGPVGWRRGSGPVCDGCLLGQAWGLGSMLLAVNVMRELGATDDSADDPEETIIALSTYAQLFERVAADRWPRRPVGVLAYLRHLEAKFDELFPGKGKSTLGQLFRRRDGDGPAN